MFTHWTTEITSADVVMHEFFGLKRLGPLGSTARDTPMPSAALVGSGSLQMQCLGQHLKGHIYRTLPAQRGWAAGMLRTRVHVPDRGNDDMSTGLYACATSTALVGGSGSVYLLGLSAFDGARRVILAKSTAGLQVLGDSTPAILAQTATGHWSVNSPLVIALTWEPSGSGMRLRYQRGTAEDFSDLATIFEVTDSVPLTSPVSQGLWIDAGTALEAVALYDTTQQLRVVA